MADRFESFDEAIKQSNEAYAAAISALSKAVENLGTRTPSSDRERLVENVLRLARMSKDGVVSAIEQGFELWERQVRRVFSAGAEAPSSRPTTAQSNPIEAWAENWRKATEAFGGGANEELRKRAETVQNAFLEGIRAWQRLWEPERR
jgi:hypothetical protein